MRFDRWVILLVLICMVGLARAQENREIGQEYVRHIKSSSVIDPMNNDLFGEMINLYTGATEFLAMDVDIAGNSDLPVGIGRRFVVEPRNGILSKGMFADWEIDIPYLYGTFPRKTSGTVVGWQVSNSSPNARCNVADIYAASPPEAPALGAASGNYFSAAEYWFGNYLHLPGTGEQEMLLISSVNTSRPTDGGGYRWVTSGQWFFSCLADTANGIVGEAFQARSPEGLIYQFDQVVRRAAATLSKPLNSGLLRVPASGGLNIRPMASNQAILGREEIRILPTRVEDRFGNWVTYTYDSINPDRLTRIKANDGRQIDLNYNNDGYIASVTDGARTWSYAYSGTSPDIGLSAVTLPNGSTWNFDLAEVRRAYIQYQPDSASCENPGVMQGNSGVGTITHPSGAIGVFTFSLQRHGRSYVDKFCLYSGLGYSGPYAYFPQTFDLVALASKRISGPGLTTATWNYSYGAANASWEEDCPASSSCPRTRTLVVAGREYWARYTFGNKWRDDEGKLLKLERGAGASTIISTEQAVYQMDATGQIYPSLVGESSNMRGDGIGQRYAPLEKATVTRQGRVFSWEVASDCGSNGASLCFDQYARPTKVVESSAPAP